MTTRPPTPAPGAGTTGQPAARAGATEVRRLRITGHVQGVYYRATMVEVAQRLGVIGWVRNRADGSVEALAAGNAQQLATLLAWAQRGPEAARVDHVAVEIGNPAELPVHGFAQHPTV